MKNKRKKRIVAVFTGNRAEYGLQLPILKAIDSHPNLDYRLIVSGAHLDENFGTTLSEISKDGFEISAEVKIFMPADSDLATSQAIGSGIIEISKKLAEIQPDLFVVYADRFEGFAAVVAATQMNIPTCHIEGGDITEGGALDDSVRHAMTKLSHLHFTTNQQATNRVLALGEESWRVHTVGFPAIDLISEDNFASKEEISSKFNLNFSKPIVLFTQHSVTTEISKSRNQIKKSLAALRRLAKEDYQIIITFPNNDSGAFQIINEIQNFQKQNYKNIFVEKSLGRYLYHGILSLAKEQGIHLICVGNSSSGIKETPVFGCPTVNIGSRQKGRLRGENVIDVDYDEDEIYLAIKRCVEDNEFLQSCKKCSNPYWLGDAGIKIAQILSEVKFDENLLRKKMTIQGYRKGEWFK